MDKASRIKGLIALASFIVLGPIIIEILRDLDDATIKGSAIRQLATESVLKTDEVNSP